MKKGVRDAMFLMPFFYECDDHNNFGEI